MTGGASHNNQPSLLANLCLLLGVISLLPIVAVLTPIGSFFPSWVIEVGNFALRHSYLYGLATIAALVLVLLALRVWIQFWWNEVKPRVAGTYEKESNYELPQLPVEFMRELQSMKLFFPDHKELYFLGNRAELQKPIKRLSRSVKSPPLAHQFYLTEKQRTMHTQVLGKTGSGKSASVIFPSIFQDAIVGKGLVFMDPKGSEENLRTIYNICLAAGRLKDLRVFSLVFPDYSHSYNPLYVKSIDLDHPKQSGDPLEVAELVMGVFKEHMDNEYYRSTAESFFRDLVQVLHRLVDARGKSIPFNMDDVLCCIQSTDILLDCLSRTHSKTSAQNIYALLEAGKPQELLAGLRNLISTYTNPLVNSYSPDIIMDEVLQQNLIVYFHLPTNFYPQLHIQIGKMVLQNLKQAAARRQIDRSINQRHFALYIDEFFNFAYSEMITTLNLLRDANIQILIAHQSMADLQKVPIQGFEQGICDNTRTKIVLNQDNPEFCTLISESIGTRKTWKITSSQTIGTLLTKIKLGDQSLREADEFVLHPNRIKNLKPFGQAYVIEGNKFAGINLGMLPPAFSKDHGPFVLHPKKAAAQGLELRKMSASVQSQTNEEAHEKRGKA